MDRSSEEINKGTPPTYVPFRNGIFLAYCVAFAESHNIQDIYCGGNGLLSGNYPDDTLEFAKSFEAAANWGTAPRFEVRILFPLANVPKTTFVRSAYRDGLDYRHTWSCYHNEMFHCGRCDSCYHRREAMLAINCNIEGRPM